MTTNTAARTLRFFRANTSALQRMSMPTTCEHCGREGLKKTVRMVGMNGMALWMGTGCANRAESDGIPEGEFIARQDERQER